MMILLNLLHQLSKGPFDTELIRISLKDLIDAWNKKYASSGKVASPIPIPNSGLKDIGIILWNIAILRGKNDPTVDDFVEAFTEADRATVEALITHTEDARFTFYDGYNRKVGYKDKRTDLLQE